MVITDIRGIASSEDDTRVLSRQTGCSVICCDDSVVIKSGCRVSANEEVALKLVEEHTNVPAPHYHFSFFSPGHRSIYMSYVPGQTLETAWPTLSDIGKQQICSEIWCLIARWRKIPRPPGSDYPYQCLANGSAGTTDPLLEDVVSPARPIVSDNDIRRRIYERYYHHHGRKYENELPSMLIQSMQAVFTHGDIVPRNIIVTDDHRVAAIIDWETAGWFPDYWEYANINKNSGEHWSDWNYWMMQTATQHWDLKGISAARKVLF